MKTQERSDGSALFDGLPMPVCLVDADWLLVAMNPAALAYWGMEPPPRLPAMHTLGIVPTQPDGWQSRSKARFRLQCRITTPDGRVHRASIVIHRPDRHHPCCCRLCRTRSRPHGASAMQPPYRGVPSAPPSCPAMPCQPTLPILQAPRRASLRHSCFSTRRILHHIDRRD